MAGHTLVIASSPMACQWLPSTVHCPFLIQYLDLESFFKLAAASITYRAWSICKTPRNQAVIPRHERSGPFTTESESPVYVLFSCVLFFDDHITRLHAVSQCGHSDSLHGNNDPLRSNRVKVSLLVGIQRDISGQAPLQPLHCSWRRPWCLSLPSRYLSWKP
jgi:hypothetical protein